MQNSDNIFITTASRVTDSLILHEIIQKQQTIFQIQPYKIEGVWGENMIKTYLSTKNRYDLATIIEEDPHNWNQNERRLFVWFIVCYTYFLQQEQKRLTPEIWSRLSTVFFGKRPEFLHFQYLNMLKFKKRVSWTIEEDQLLIQATKELKPGKWNSISKRIFYDSDQRIFRTPKHCRQRWLNHLDQNKKRGGWTTSEDLTIFEYTLSKGKRWSKMVDLLDGARTEHMIKNRYNSLVAKWRSGKKQKEEDIVRNIIAMMSQNVQRVKKEEVSSQLAQNQNAQVKNIGGQINQAEEEDYSESPQRVEEQPRLLAPIALPPLPFGCFMNYNPYYWYNDYMLRNHYSFGQPNSTQNQSFPVSHKSSFSNYEEEPMKNDNSLRK